MLDDNRRYFLGIDVGTTKVASMMAIEESDRARILGLGAYPSEGLKKGVVVDKEQTIHAIKSSLKEVELSSGIKLKNCVIGIAGSHIYSFNNKGVVGIRKDQVTQYDQNRAIAAAREVVLPTDREIIHAIPQSFRIDQSELTKNPIGISGKKLEANLLYLCAFFINRPRPIYQLGALTYNAQFFPQCLLGIKRFYLDKGFFITSLLAPILLYSGPIRLLFQGKSLMYLFTILVGYLFFFHEQILLDPLICTFLIFTSLIPIEWFFQIYAGRRSYRNGIYLIYILICLLDSHVEGCFKHTIILVKNYYTMKVKAKYGH